ncbi:MAG: hypothetical protein OQL08_11125 [Gammaproteobacteria bacterium]|nr:hypothetical protein [Gammaproteobacteria bacterium]
MAENILILAPAPFDATPPDHGMLLKTLRERRFIADTLEINGALHYHPGEAFMTLITFLGCSPMIATGGKHNGEQSCHIAIEGPSAEPHFLAGDNLKIPRCPYCGHRYDDWQAVVNAWRAAPYAKMTCAECGETLSATQLRWRKCAGFGRLFIKVWGIFESEAVPSPNLLSLLESCSGTEWQHFYIRHN